MSTLYIRNVPEGVAAALETMAKSRGMSVNALLLAELASIADRAHNAALFGALPSHPSDPEEIVRAIHEGREERDRHLDEVMRKLDRH